MYCSTRSLESVHYFLCKLGMRPHTLVCRIDVQGKINVQVEKFLKNIKRAGRNKRAGGEIFWKIRQFLMFYENYFTYQRSNTCCIHTSQFDFVLCMFCIMPVIFQMISISENILNIPIPINVQDGINVQGGIFTQNQ